MKFTQKALLFHRAEFEFGDKRLTYRIEDEKARAGFSVLYENINIEKSLQSYREKAPLYLAAIFLLAGIFALLVPPGPHHSHVPQALNWTFILAGWACLLAGRFTKFDATVIGTPLGRMLVFDRAQQQDIIDEIYRRRTSELRRKYLAVDFLNDPQGEIAKYRRLKAEGVISDAEFDSAIETISAARDDGGRP
jgi:hypothetical protein